MKRPTRRRLMRALAVALLLVAGCASRVVRRADGEDPAASPARPEGTIFTGVIVPMLTCYRDGDPEQVDLDAMAQLTEWLCSTRATGLFPVSGMGQWERLREAEKTAIIETVVRVAAGRKPILAGVGSATDVEETIRVARWAQEVGADGIVVVTPNWLRDPEGRGIPDQDALYDYYEKISRRVVLPMMIYDRKAEVLPATMTRLAELPNVAAIKYRTADAVAIVRMVKAAGDRVAVLAGIEHITLAVLGAGGRGVVGGGANLFPDLLAEMVSAHRAGDRGKALVLQARVVEANDHLRPLGGGKIGIKRMLRDVVGLERIAVNGRGAGEPPEPDAKTLHEHRSWLVDNAGVRPWRAAGPR